MGEVDEGESTGVRGVAGLMTGCLGFDETDGVGQFAVVGGAVGVAGAVVGGAVDLVTTSEDEQLKKDVEAMKKDKKDKKD